MKHFALSLLLLASTFAFGQENNDAADKAVSVPKPYDITENRKFKKVEYSSFYLTMRDGNKIAVEVYLPKGLKEGEKIPTIMHQTRYWRSFEARWPYKWFIGNMFGVLKAFVAEFNKQGYAIVNVDARGSGASYGFRPYPWHENEVKDGAEVADWIVKQDWSNGMIGAAGASYSGTTSEFLLTNNHPNVKAVVNMYSLFDVYEDNAFPGGLHNIWFTSVWGNANEKLDKNELPTTNKQALRAIKGVSPVEGKDSRKYLAEAIASHAENRNVNDGAMKVVFRDDNPDADLFGEGFDIDVFSPHKYVEQEEASQAAVYNYSGWMDGSYQHAAIKRFLTLSNPESKLILGPWEHGGSFNTSPFTYGKSAFNHLAELLKFFDYHLKGIDNGLDKEARVHYYTLGEEQWKASDVWPPANSTYKSIYFNEDNGLSWEVPQVASGADAYKVDTTVGTGSFTRYESVASKLKQAHVYPDRAEKSKGLLIYESAPISGDMEITGHALAKLFLSADAEDAQIIVYLDEVDKNGNINYITEGMLRAVHRKVSDNPPYESAVPYHSFKKEDAMPLVPGEVAELVFDFLPISYQVKKGHKLRLSIAGHDKDHFRNIYRNFDKLPTFNIHHSKEYPSSVELPIVGK